MNKKRLYISVVIIAIVLGIVVVCHGKDIPVSMFPSISEDSLREIYKCKVVKVIDGDTIDVIIDLGYGIFKKERMRFYGVNAPESRTRNVEEKVKGLAAKEFVKKRIDKKNILIDISEGTGKYGRYLSVIYYLKDDGEWSNLNAEMLVKGHAIEYYGGAR